MPKQYCIVLLFLSLIIGSCSQASNTGKRGDTVQAESLVVPDMHNAQNALDVAGTYKGTLPCADCPGIETTVTLKDDSTFEQTSKYLGKGNNTFNKNGKWHFLADGNTIALDDGKQGTARLKVGENTLTMLDGEGHLITGALAAHYVLKKQ